jgi:glucose-1-phosphate thymidylyltransferase
LEVILAKGVIVASADPTADRPLLDPRLAAPLVPVANRPILFHALESMREAGIADIAIVSSPSSAEDIGAAVGDGRAWGLHVTHLVTNGNDGPGAPLQAAQSFVDDAPFILQRGDGLLGDALSSFAELLDEERPDVMLLVHRQLARRRAELESRRLLRAAGVQAAPGMTGVAGVYLFGAGALRGARRALGTGADGMGLADVVEHVTDGGGRVHVRPVRDWRCYTGDVQDLLEMNRIVLDEIEREVDETDEGGNRIHGRVVVHPTARVEHSVIRGPAIVGAGARVIDAYIGPYTAIGEGARIEGAEIEHSIILEKASILHIGGRLEASVVGRGAKVYRDFSLPRALRLQVGDDVEVALC